MKKLAVSAALAAALLAQTVAVNPALAEHVEEADQHEPLVITLQNDIDGETVDVGDPFTGTLAHNYEWNGRVLPEGTIFRGHVSEVGEPKSNGIARYISLEAEQAKLPNGMVFQLDGDDTIDHKYGHQKTWPQRLLRSAMFGATSAAVSIPLRVAADMSGPAVTAISYGARATLGVILEHTIDRKEGWPEERRVVVGMLRGTGVPRGIDYIHPPQADYVAGEQIELYLDPTALEGLFAMSGQEYRPLLRK